MMPKPTRTTNLRPTVLASAALCLALGLAGKGTLAMSSPTASATRPGPCVVTIGGKKLTAQTHAIAVPGKPTPQERHAASDLQLHLEAITGEKIPVLADAHIGDRIPIIVGKSELLARYGLDVDFASLGLEGIVIKTAGPVLALAGSKRGVLYACYTFLEDYLGCRWLTPDCTVLPTRGAFNIKDLDRRCLPPLEYRATDYPNSRDADWAVRNKMNGSYTFLDDERGGKIAYRGFVHTFNSLVPPETYFADHPEYYSEIDGERVGPDGTQLCLTNPDVLRLATDTLRRWIEESPEASIFSVSQNDWGNYCQCASCTALAEKEGSQSGPLLHFVNAIADAIAPDHPGKTIDTLAYQYTRKPPAQVRPRPNVVVRLCSIECCFAHPLETDPYNASFRQDNETWAKVSSRLWVWDYVINYSHTVMPFPNLYVLKPNINFFLRNGVTGIYEEANYFSPGGEFAELRTYIIAKTLWDPTYDTDRAIDEFLAGYYQQAARPIRDYIDLLHRQVRENPDLHVGIYADPSVGYLTPEVIQRSVALFDQAEAAVKGDPTVLHRVQVARLPIVYAQIALSDKSDPQRPALVDRFEQIARAAAVTRVAESGEAPTLDQWLAKVRQ